LKPAKPGALLKAVPNPLEALTQQTGGLEYALLSRRDLETAHEIKVVVERPYRARSRPGYWMAARTR